MTRKYEEYKIQVKGPNGPEAHVIDGVIVGPFGVARNKYVQKYTDGTKDEFHKVTHLHSGLCIQQLSSFEMDNCIAACEELMQAVPWWRSHKISRIENENRLDDGELKSIILDIAARNGCQSFNYED